MREESLSSKPAKNRYKQRHIAYKYLVKKPIIDEPIFEFYLLQNSPQAGHTRFGTSSHSSLRKTTFSGNSDITKESKIPKRDMIKNPDLWVVIARLIILVNTVHNVYGARILSHHYLHITT